MSNRDEEQAVRELAYSLWESEGRPDGREIAHWELALAVRSDQERNPDDKLDKDAEAVLDGDPHADLPALLTKDVPGG
jgi:Protein of unknown function (DUF2934)